jgi:hypothetical protein
MLRLASGILTREQLPTRWFRYTLTSRHSICFSLFQTRHWKSSSSAFGSYSLSTRGCKCRTTPRRWCSTHAITTIILHYLFARPLQPSRCSTFNVGYLPALVLHVEPHVNLISMSLGMKPGSLQHHPFAAFCATTASAVLKRMAGCAGVVAPARCGAVR